jgi:hypothetical protein
MLDLSVRDNGKRRNELTVELRASGQLGKLLGYFLGEIRDVDLGVFGTHSGKSNQRLIEPGHIQLKSELNKTAVKIHSNS